MKTSVDLIVTNAAQLVTCAGENNHPKRGDAMRDVGIIKDGAMAVQGGVIVATGTSDDITTNYDAPQIINATGKAIIPGLVDCHTHVMHYGNRYNEFEMRITGKSYMQIMESGGGIMSTVNATRMSMTERLVDASRARLNAMLSLGTTTAEIKTGYGLSAHEEQRLFDMIIYLRQTHPIAIVPTYLGAHTRPPEFKTNADYLASLYPALKKLPASKLTIFADIFVEKGVFTVDDMRDYFAQARQHGLWLKAHLDQFESLGGVPVAVQLGATSVDHLEVTTDEDLDLLAESGTVGVMLPAVNFNLGLTQFGNARRLIDKGGILALATDYNPGSSPTPSLPLVMAIACRYMKLTPAEALNACTVNAAAALRLGQSVGSLAVGKQADWVMLNTDDYRAMIVEFGRNFVDEVYIKGARVYAA